ncbi:glycosyltransferase [Arthrobacter parietis]|uniref:glycosyltransferase n=1 Tax=Arthrobacter parietis TaxID=271434 RepID=UPI0031F7D566
MTKGTLRVPPTYFALTHAEKMSDLHQFEVFCLVADLSTDSSVPVNDYVPLRQLGFRRRELVMPGFIPSMVGGVKKFHPDIIHQHFGTWAVAAAHVAMSTRVPLVTTLHGADVFALQRPPSTAMARWHHYNVRVANKQSRKLLAVSNFLAAEAIAAGLDPRKLEVHYQGIDTDYFTPAEKVRSSELGEKPMLLFVGGLSEGKGIRDLIAASGAVNKSAPHKLVIVGDGDLRAEVRQTAAEFTHIELVGPQDKELVRDWMRRARALVVPSRMYKGAREAAGLVALEAAACGVPVVANDSGGLREMMVPGSTGLLVREGHIDDLGEAIREIIQLPAHSYAAMSSAARKFAVEERSLNVSCAELAGHYEDIRGQTL